jgi:hypothetical protein
MSGCSKSSPSSRASNQEVQATFAPAAPGNALRQQNMTDTHSPGEYRSNGVLRNIPEFYRAPQRGAGRQDVSPARAAREDLVSSLGPDVRSGSLEQTPATAFVSC